MGGWPIGPLVRRGVGGSARLGGPLFPPMAWVAGLTGLVSAAPSPTGMGGRPTRPSSGRGVGGSLGIGGGGPC
eukprot:6680964-Alexandrium_andersonii.AAC.1